MDVSENLAGYKKGEEGYDYNTYLKNLLAIIEKDKDKNKYGPAVVDAIRLGPEEDDEDIKAKIELLVMFRNGRIPKVADIKGNYGEAHHYIDGDAERNTSFNELSEKKYYKDLEGNYPEINGFQGGNRRNKPKSKPKAKHDDMNMKDVKDLCKANQIKLSKVVNEKRVRFTKKELLTKLKRKKLI
jgi:hypothetical protein